MVEVLRRFRVDSQHVSDVQPDSSLQRLAHALEDVKHFFLSGWYKLRVNLNELLDAEAELCFVNYLIHF